MANYVQLLKAANKFERASVTHRIASDAAVLSRLSMHDSIDGEPYHESKDDEIQWASAANEASLEAFMSLEGLGIDDPAFAKRVKRTKHLVDVAWDSPNTDSRHPYDATNASHQASSGCKNVATHLLRMASKL